MESHGLLVVFWKECSQCPSPLLESVTFVDTPGVLSGSSLGVDLIP